MESYEVDALALSTRGLGSIIMNIAMAYSASFKDHEAAYERIMTIARSCIATSGVFKHQSPETEALAQEIAREIVAQCDRHGRDHFRRRRSASPDRP